MMTKKEAFNFLKKNQPMPKDAELNEHTIKKYNEVREFFVRNPDEQSIPLFLNSFGGKNGLGVYQVVEDVILEFEKEVVIPHILQALRSPHDSVKYWTIQIASNYPDYRLFAPLIRLVKNEDHDIRIATVITLAMMASCHIKEKEIIKIIEDQIKQEEDEDNKIFMTEILEDIMDGLR